MKEDLWEHLIGVNLLNYKLKTKLLLVIFDIHVKCNFLTDIEKKWSLQTCIPRRAENPM